MAKLEITFCSLIQEPHLVRFTVRIYGFFATGLYGLVKDSFNSIVVIDGNDSAGRTSVVLNK